MLLLTFVTMVMAYVLLSIGAVSASGAAAQKVTLCHATGSATNPYVTITVSANALDQGHSEHAVHVNDIIPAPAGGCPKPTTPPNNEKITICHATGSASNPFVTITVSKNGLNGHGGHAGDIIPAPANGCGTPPPPPPPPTDVCPNIDGAQATIPEGMILLDGNCVTPPAVVPTDVCPNIEGVQSSVPTGLVLSDGNCVAPGANNTPPETDVCPNIDGAQASVPANLVQNAAGNCVVFDSPDATAGETDTPTATAGATDAPADTAAPATTLPFTGLGIGILGMLGASLIGAGLLLHLGGRRIARARA